MQRELVELVDWMKPINQRIALKPIKIALAKRDVPIDIKIKTEFVERLVLIREKIFVYERKGGVSHRGTQLFCKFPLEGARRILV